MVRFTDAKKKLVELKKKKKSFADEVNETFNTENNTNSNKYGIAEEYEWEEEHENENNIKNRKRKRENNDHLLRKRGPLEDSLSSGKYASQVIDTDSFFNQKNENENNNFENENYNAANIESQMDDLFGALEMGEDTLDQEMDDDSLFYENDENEKKNKKKKSLKQLTEEEYIAYLEKKQNKNNNNENNNNAPGSTEESILQQLQELQQNRIQLLQNNNNENENKNNQNFPKQLAQEFLSGYAQLLKIRMKLQSAVHLSVQLPQYYAKSFFETPISENDNNNETKMMNKNVKEIEKNYEIITEACQSLLKELYDCASRFQNNQNNLKKRKLEYESIQNFHQFTLQKANQSLSYWGDKLLFYKNNNNNSLKTVSQSLPTQIENIISSQKTRLTQKLQKNKSHLYIYGHPTHFRAAEYENLKKQNNNQNNNENENYNLEDYEAAKATRAETILNGDIDEEIINDNDFLLELIHHTASGLEKKNLLNSNHNYEKKEDSKSRKKFYKLTKGKHINYEPKPKLIGFMIAEGFENPQQTNERSEVVIHHLFQDVN